MKSGCGLYYYKREDSTLEEDFFVRTASELIPVEVKATNGRAKVPAHADFQRKIRRYFPMGSSSPGETSDTVIISIHFHTSAHFY